VDPGGVASSIWKHSVFALPPLRCELCPAVRPLCRAALLLARNSSAPGQQAGLRRRACRPGRLPLLLPLLPLCLRVPKNCRCGSCLVCSWVINNLYAPASDGAAAVVHAASVPWGRDRAAAAAVNRRWAAPRGGRSRAAAPPLPDLRVRRASRHARRCCCTGAAAAVFLANAA
jgi:hypothetical protein